MVPPAGATDTFVYTITDGDGDTSTTTLTITLTTAALRRRTTTLTVNEAALATRQQSVEHGARRSTGTVADNVTRRRRGPFTFALVSSADAARTAR